MLIKNFNHAVLRDYETSLDVFFDADSGAVLEPGREDGSPRFLFTEVTGYAILDFLLLHTLTGRPQYLAKVVKSANWMKDQAQDASGGMLTRFYFARDDDPSLADKSFAGRRIYAFDTAICLRGMVAAYKATGNHRYLDSSLEMADFLLNAIVDTNGHTHAIYDAKRMAPIEPDPDIWSRCFGAYHTKVAEALIDLHEVSGNDAHRRAAVDICEAALGFQRPDGQIETSSGRTELHPHCYATEGLLHVGRKTGDAKLIEAARRATEWALRQCNDGEIAQSFDSPTSKPAARSRTDALAQVLALGSDLRQMGQLNRSLEPKLDALAGKILSMKFGSPPYYRYGHYERPIGGKLEADTRSYWTNMFCLRGLFKYYLSGIVENTYVTILAGGIGSRVWPISCENRPKPVSLSLLGDRSLLQETIRRYKHGYLIRPDQIFVLCSRNALELASRQAADEGLPSGNCVIEPEPKGTIPAVNLACQGLPPARNASQRIVVVSMADNVIAPYEKFQTALTSALFAAHENDALISIGRPLEQTDARDERFGHMVYEHPIEAYRTCEVDRFAEKPNQATFDELKQLQGNIAWESGTVVFRESYFHAVVPASQSSGNLAEHLLTKAAPWRAQTDRSVKVATALLDPGVQFEDFGVPGKNMMAFFKGHDRYDRGNGNICIGRPDQVNMVACSNNLVISDELPIEIYGLEGFVVIDNAVTNTTVVMKQTEVHHLPSLYRLFLGSRDYEPFVAGGPKAQTATPTTFVERSPNATSRSAYGLVFAFNFSERLSIERTRTSLRITNDDLPRLTAQDFSVFVVKQTEDPMLVEHLVRVGAVAKAFAQGDLVLSRQGADLLNNLCLYHAFGGYLTDEGERRENAAIAQFKQVSALDTRLLDSRVAFELMRMNVEASAPGHAEQSWLLNKNINSAVEFLRRRKMADSRLRDWVVGLLQAQNSPALFGAFKESLPGMGAADFTEELTTTFACFKFAQHVCNGRWLWKRSRRENSDMQKRWFLEHDRGALEEFPFIVAYSISWLRSAGIDPRPYVEQFNELVGEDGSVFMRFVREMQLGRPPLVCDEIYRTLLRSRNSEVACVEALIDQHSAVLVGDPHESFQWRQLLELPKHLNEISAHSSGLPADAAETVQEAVLDLYHRNWRLLKGRVPAEVLRSTTIRSV